MIGHIELRNSWILLEALQPAPRHVLYNHQSAVSRNQKVEPATSDDDVFRALDDGLQDAGLRRGQGEIARVRAIWPGKDIVEVAFIPVRRWSVNGGLDVAAIEVDICAGRFVAKGEVSERVVGKGTSVRDVVDIEAGVDFKGGIVDLDLLQQGKDTLKAQGLHRRKCHSQER